MSQSAPPLQADSAARVLGVDRDPDPQALKTAFHAAVKQTHPDRPGGDGQRFRAVIEAYAILKARAHAIRAPTAERAPPAQILEISPLEAMCGGRAMRPGLNGERVEVLLPPGMRAGDQVRVGGRVFSIAISGQAGLAVIGDHLCMTLEADGELLRRGGVLVVETPLGPRRIRITRQDGLRGLVRVIGEGLPPRAGRPRGDLLLRLNAAAADVVKDTPALRKLRRFMANWAA